MLCMLSQMKVEYTAKIKVIPVHLQQDTFKPVGAFLSNKLPNFDVMHDTPFNSKKCYISLCNWYKVC